MSNKPMVRFSEFENDSNEIRLKDLIHRVRGNDEKMDLPTLTISADKGWMDQRDRFSANIAGKEQKNYTLLSRNELSYNHGNSKLAKYGVVFKLKDYSEALVPRVYHSFKVTDNASADFIEHLFATKKTDKELGKLVTSGARMDGLLNINYDAFSNIKINVPCVEEQIKIGNFFNQLDETIELHQHALDLLKLRKKAFLQKMFPKKGESIPVIRFSGFKGDWNKKKIREIGNISAGGDIDKSKLVDNGKYPVLANALRNEGVIGYYNSYKIEEPAVTITGRGDIGHAKARFTNFSPVVRLLVLKVKDFDVNFLENSINSINIFVESTGVPQLTSPQFGGYDILFPTLKEQQKIGNFLKELDSSITLQEEKLESLKQMKKAFLQKMFV